MYRSMEKDEVPSTAIAFVAKVRERFLAMPDTFQTFATQLASLASVPANDEAGKEAVKKVTYAAYKILAGHDDLQKGFLDFLPHRVRVSLRRSIDRYK